MTLEIVLPTWHFQNYLKEISVKGVLNTMGLSIGIIYLLKQKMQIPLKGMSNKKFYRSI
jgi:hypothetical protein